MYRLNRITVIFAFVLVLAGIINCAASESSLSIEQTFQKAKSDLSEKTLIPRQSKSKKARRIKGGRKQSRLQAEGRKRWMIRRGAGQTG